MQHKKTPDRAKSLPLSRRHPGRSRSLQARRRSQGRAAALHQTCRRPQWPARRAAGLQHLPLVPKYRLPCLVGRSTTREVGPSRSRPRPRHQPRRRAVTAHGGGKRRWAPPQTCNSHHCTSWSASLKMPVAAHRSAHPPPPQTRGAPSGRMNVPAAGADAAATGDGAGRPRPSPPRRD